jgi:ABC-2 type transport system ATP-binding protein
MDEAQHCDRIALLRQGQLLAEGTPVDVVKSAGAANLEEAFLALAKREDGRL